MTTSANTICLTKYRSNALLRCGSDWERRAHYRAYALDFAATFRVLIKISNAVKRTGKVPAYLVKLGHNSVPRAEMKPDMHRNFHVGEVYATNHALEPYGRFAVLDNGDITLDGRVVHPESLELLIGTVLKAENLTEVSK